MRKFMEGRIVSDPKPPLTGTGDAFGRERVDKAPRSKKVTPETHYRTASGDYAPYPKPAASDGIYQQNQDGSWSPAEPLGWLEEHNRWQRFWLWLLRRPHCSDEAHNDSL
jgi:hypothetical protein